MINDESFGTKVFGHFIWSLIEGGVNRELMENTLWGMFQYWKEEDPLDLTVHVAEFSTDGVRVLFAFPRHRSDYLEIINELEKAMRAECDVENMRSGFCIDIAFVQGRDAVLNSGSVENNQKLGE